MFRTFSFTLATLAAIGTAGAVNAGGLGHASHTYGGTYGGGHTGGYCPPGKPPGGSTINIHKPIRIYKPINIDRSIRINKQINIEHNINIHKNIVINKPVIINKGSSSSEAVAIANAAAAAQSQSASSAVALASGGSSVVDVEAPRGGGDFGNVQAEAQCVDQWAIVVKAIHAECVDRSGGHHPATRMRAETWVDSSQNIELYRCLEGSHLRIQIGDVVDSQGGMAGVFEGSQVLECKAGQALRHFRDGTVKCAPAEHVVDYLERRNMRRYGMGDLFFSYHAKICARVSSSSSASYSYSHSTSHAASSGSEVEVEGSFNGGVGN